MAANRIAALISKALPEETDQAVQLITALTGEDSCKLSKMSIDELLMYLSFLLKCNKEQTQSLLSEHNQNVELDAGSLAKLWKLVAKHSIPNKRRTFGTIENPEFERMKAASARLGDESTKKVELGEALQKTSIQPLKNMAAQINMRNILHRMAMSIANNNSPTTPAVGGGHR